jgi:MFS family permease
LSSPPPIPKPTPAPEPGPAAALAPAALAPAAPAPAAPARALAVTLVVQTLAAGALTCPSVLAPVVAGEIGVGAQHVGWLISVAYLTAMVAGLGAGSLSQRWGPVRISQAALLAAAVGATLLALGHPAALLAGAVVLGVAYGLPNPTAAEILSRHAPAHRRGLFFAIKQTGVPLGVAAAGAALPLLLLQGLSWSAALLVVAAAIGAAALAIGPSRAGLEVAAMAGGHGARPAAPRAPGLAGIVRDKVVAPLREVLGDPRTRRLAIASLMFALTQVSFLTFLVSLLKVEHGFSLGLAASLLSASQAASVVGRIGWGHAADRWFDPTRLLGALGVAMGAAVLLLALAPADAPAGLMLALTLVCAVTVVGWNGVFFADLVRLVPPERVARATGATQFLTFMGGVGGSALFAAGVSVSGSYTTAFVALAVLPAVTGLMLLAGSRGQRSR